MTTLTLEFRFIEKFQKSSKKITFSSKTFLLVHSYNLSTTESNSHHWFLRIQKNIKEIEY